MLRKITFRLNTILRKLFKKSHILDQTFINNVSNGLNPALQLNNIRFTVEPAGFVNGESGSFIFELISPAKPPQILRLKICSNGQNLLYFELLECTILYFPYLTDIWNTINSHGMRNFIINEWNQAATRNNLPNLAVISYY